MEIPPEPDQAFAFFQRVQARLIGRPIVGRQLMGNSISLHVDDADGTAWSIFLNPSWHLLSGGRVLAGSAQAADEDDPTGFEHTAELLDMVVARTVESLRLDPVSWALTVELSGDIQIRTFVIDPRTPEAWRIRNLSTIVRHG